MKKKIIIIIGIILVLVIAISIIFAVTQPKEENKKGKAMTMEEVRVEAADYLERWKTENWDNIMYRTEVTPSGSAFYFEPGKMTYITPADQMYQINFDTEGITGDLVLLEDTNNNQFFQSIHPEKHIPTGFKHTTGEWNTGYVIEDKDKNEFVWIPVADSSAYQKKLGPNDWAVTTIGQGSTKLEEEVKGDYLGVTEILGKTVVNSDTAGLPEAGIVNNAGGFWVGRYEAGIDSKEEAFNIDWANAKILEKRGVQPARCVSVENIYKLANNWRSGEADESKKTVAFQSGLITGTQWDMVCKFIGWDTANSEADSWGNYATIASEKYTGYHSSEKSSDWVYEKNVVKEGATVSENNPLADGKGWVFPTGTFKNSYGGDTSKKNIYDIAGNVWEWTTEIPYYDADNDYIIRGGCAGDPTKFIATSRCGSPWYTWNVGFRMVLYVE